MKLGILSDNHGRLELVEAAISEFERHAVSDLVHCGDLGGPQTFELLAGYRTWFVWGNTDYPEPNWRPLIESCGGLWPEQIPVQVHAAGKSIAVCHGHEPVFTQACRSGQYDYVLYGHTHKADDTRVGPTRIINPGALYRAAIKTIAILELDSDNLQFIELQPRSTRR